MKQFIDTGAFIALTDTSDENHHSAKHFYISSKEKGIKFVTTNFVVCETLNYLRAKIAHDTAVAFREGLRKSSVFEIIDITLPLNNAAFHIFKQYADKDFSFTDCTSFAAMQSLKLRKAFAFDKHFEQYGNFERLP
ncbi:MAG: PIN domain-containing protein [Nitrospirae bacterium]|nr:PIN domain-containing protein [Nitrospirota bacterium]